VTPSNWRHANWSATRCVTLTVCQQVHPTNALAEKHPGVPDFRNIGVRLRPRGDTLHTHTAAALVKPKGSDAPSVSTLPLPLPLQVLW
jgi:hypothetical protein